MKSLFLNCFEVANAPKLAYDVSLYRVKRTDGQHLTHESRGEMKNAAWEAKKLPGSKCRGYGFIVDVGEDEIMVPSTWVLAAGPTPSGFILSHRETKRISGTNRKDLGLIGAILRDGIKKHFKETQSEHLGELWQDYDHFCQMPEIGANAQFLNCRKFQVTGKVLSGGRLVALIGVSTTVLDGRPISDYYSKGELAELLDYIDLKLANRSTRRNEPVAVRVWCDDNSFAEKRILDLLDIEVIRDHARLPSQGQASLATRPIKCKRFNEIPRDVAPDTIRLVLDTQITQEDHAETILSPGERWRLIAKVREFVNGADIYGNKLELASSPASTSKFRATQIRLPAIRVRGADGTTVIETVGEPTTDSIAERSKKRTAAIRRYGFLQDRPIEPLLAYPKEFGEARAKRLTDDLNTIWHQQGIAYKFGEPLAYTTAEDIRTAVEKQRKNSLFAVLPKEGRSAANASELHEQIKRRIQVPSQCILSEHTLPARLANRSTEQLRMENNRFAISVNRMYSVALANLLVKMNWIPFAPQEAFTYNVHVGLDVGGRNNNRVMACMGYGFKNPEHGLVFRPEDIPVETSKAEPIPAKALYDGLLNLFEFMDKELKESGRTPDFGSVLFYRDGQLMGSGDLWNEREALENLHDELVARKWITETAKWTAVEVMKRAEGWRLFATEQDICNPLVGHCVFPFEDQNEGLICTTGRPYLTQGTASPIKIRIVNISGAGQGDEIAKDLIWQADMCYTKVDQGLSLPWVLHVADTGALQASLSYKITGITA